MGFIGSHDKKAKFKRKTAGSTAVIGFRAVLGRFPSSHFLVAFLVIHKFVIVDCIKAAAAFCLEFKL